MLNIWIFGEVITAARNNSARPAKIISHVCVFFRSSHRQQVDLYSSESSVIWCFVDGRHAIFHPVYTVVDLDGRLPTVIWCNELEDLFQRLQPLQGTRIPTRPGPVACHHSTVSLSLSSKFNKVDSEGNI